MDNVGDDADQNNQEDQFDALADSGNSNKAAANSSAGQLSGLLVQLRDFVNKWLMTKDFLILMLVCVIVSMFFSNSKRPDAFVRASVH